MADRLKRINRDCSSLAREHDVEIPNQADLTRLVVNFNGPPNSLYSGYCFKVEVEFDEDYPVRPPLVHFHTKIYHPNIDYDSGYPCVDALDPEGWKGDSRLQDIFNYVLPQLLCQPNFEDSYNLEANELNARSEEEYNAKVKEMCELHAEKQRN